MLYIGIDPGLTGAVAMIQEIGDEDAILIWDIPIIAMGARRKQLNMAGMTTILRTSYPESNKIIAAIEGQQAMPGQGVSSVFSLGQTYGGIMGCLAALGIGYEIISPSVWKKAYRLSKNKELSRTRALELYPDCAPYLSRKKDHGRAEALLLADYLRRRRLAHHKAIPARSEASQSTSAPDALPPGA